MLWTFLYINHEFTADTADTARSEWSSESRERNDTVERSPRADDRCPQMGNAPLPHMTHSRDARDAHGMSRSIHTDLTPLRDRLCGYIRSRRRVESLEKYSLVQYAGVSQGAHWQWRDADSRWERRSRLAPSWCFFCVSGADPLS